MPRNSECEFVTFFFACVLVNLMIITTVNFNKINLLVGKFLKILTNRISGLRLGDFQGRERDQYSLHKLYKLVKSSLFLF